MRVRLPLLPPMKPLSRKFLEERKQCCGSGCTNCPYEPKHEKGTKQLRPCGGMADTSSLSLDALSVRVRIPSGSPNKNKES